MTTVLERQSSCELLRRLHVELRGSEDGIVWLPWCFHCWMPWDGEFPRYATWQTGRERFVQARVVEGTRIVDTSPVFVWEWWVAK